MPPKYASFPIAQKPVDQKFRSSRAHQISAFCPLRMNRNDGMESAAKEHEVFSQADISKSQEAQTETIGRIASSTSSCFINAEGKGYFAHIQDFADPLIIKRSHWQSQFPSRQTVAGDGRGHLQTLYSTLISST
jgi:hypothetical protein